MSGRNDHKTIDIVLERTIHVRWNGVESTGLASVGPIVWVAKMNCWGCHWSIHQIDPEGHLLFGADPLQAMDIALRFVSRVIRGSIEGGIEMWHEHPGDACGFNR